MTRVVETVAVGAAVALAAFLAFGDVPVAAEWQAAAFFSVFGVLAAVLGYPTSKTTHGTIGFLPYLSVALVSPNIAALLTVFASTLVAELVLRRPLVKLVFNTAQQTLSVAIGITGYLALGGVSALADTPNALPFLVLAVSYFVVNKLAVSTVVALSAGGRTAAHWAKSIVGSAVYDALALPLILFFAIAYARLGPGWTAILAMPMLLMRQLYQALFALQKINEELLQLMVAAIEARDPYTSGHSQRVSRYARIIGRASGLSGKHLERTATAALLHDVGKIHEEFAIILRKPGALTDEEFEVMKTHPTKSAALIAKVSHFADLVPAVQSHHEAWDGRGYPHRLRAAEIPMGARIIAFADTIDAMTTNRPYREAMTPEEVRREIDRERGRQFDPSICEQLLAPAVWAELTREIDNAKLEFPVSSQTEVVLVGRTGEFAIVSG